MPHETRRSSREGCQQYSSRSGVSTATTRGVHTELGAVLLGGLAPSELRDTRHSDDSHGCDVNLASQVRVKYQVCHRESDH